MTEPTDKYYYTFKDRLYWTDPTGHIHTDINFDPLGGVIDGYDTAVFNSYEEYINSPLYNQVNLGYTGLNKDISREKYFNILKSGFGPLTIKYKSDRKPLYEENEGNWPTEEYYFTLRPKNEEARLSGVLIDKWFNPYNRLTSVDFDPLNGIIDGYETVEFYSLEEFLRSDIYKNVISSNVILDKNYWDFIFENSRPVIFKIKDKDRKPLYENSLNEFFDHNETPTSDFYGKFEKGVIWLSADDDLVSNIKFDPLGGIIDGYDKYVYDNFESLYKSPFIKLYSKLCGPWSNDDAGLRKANQYFRNKVRERGPLIVMAKDKNRKPLYEGREDETPTEEYYFKPDKKGYHLWFNPRHSATHVEFDDIDGFADGYITIHFNNLNELKNSFIFNRIKQSDIADFRHLFEKEGPITFKYRSQNRKSLYEEYEDNLPTEDFYYKMSNSNLLDDNEWYDPDSWVATVDFDPLGGAIDGYEMVKCNTYDDLINSDAYKNINKKDTMKYFVDWENNFHNMPMIFMIKNKDRKPLYEEYEDNLPTDDFYYKPSNPGMLRDKDWYNPGGYRVVVDFDPLGGIMDGYEMVKFDTFDEFINSDIYKNKIKKSILQVPAQWRDNNITANQFWHVFICRTANQFKRLGSITFKVKNENRKPLYEEYEDHSPTADFYYKPSNPKFSSSLDPHFPSNRWYDPEGWFRIIDFDPLGGAFDGYEKFEFKTFDDFINSDVYKHIIKKDTEADFVEQLVKSLMMPWTVNFHNEPLTFMIKDKDRKPLYEELKKIKRLNEAINQTPITKQTATTKQYQATMDKSPLIKNRSQQIDSMYEFPSAFETWFDSLGIKDKPGISQSALIARMKDIMNKMGVK